MARPRRSKYVSKLPKEEQMVRLILQIMSRDEKRRKRELNLNDDILLIDMATRIQLGLLTDFPEDEPDEEDGIFGRQSVGELAGKTIQVIKKVRGGK
jgi:hypothetical protein